jgi:two-component system, chemotaxis family, chemotaxis protein CheY
VIEQVNSNATPAKRLLIVDDALIMRRRIMQIAELAGWSVVGEAKDGREAVAMFRQQKPDLVTMDIVMPEMDGVEALRQMIAEEPRAQIVMISAVNQKDKLAECLRAGAQDFIVKPFEKSELLAFFTKQLATNNRSLE